MPVNAPLKAGRGNAGCLLPAGGSGLAPHQGNRARGREPTFPPCLEHQQAPDLAAPVARSGKMLLPSAADWRGVQEALGDQAMLVEQVLGPVPERAAQPVGQRDRESLLGTLRQLGRQVAME